MENELTNLSYLGCVYSVYSFRYLLFEVSIIRDLTFQGLILQLYEVRILFLNSDQWYKQLKTTLEFRFTSNSPEP